MMRLESKLRLIHGSGPGEPRAPIPDVLVFLELLWAVVHGLERTSKRMTRDMGVTGPQRLVLRVVGLFPGLSAGDLAGILHVHASTLTGVLRRLKAQGLVRRAVLRLTRQGMRANLLRAGTVEAAVANALDGIGQSDRAAAARVLARLAEHLDLGLQRASQRQRRRAPAGREDAP
jgi:MarR family transcriptional regulator, organic hydroperoxide resistance regulator